MFEDTLNSIKVILHERISQPLIYSFVISWIIINYKLFIVIFGDANAGYKLALISENVFMVSPWYYSLPLKGIIYPIITSLIYLYIYLPKLAKPIYEHWLENITEIAESKKKIEGKQLLDEDESRKIRRKILEQEIEFDEIIKEKNIQITELKTLLASQEEPARENELSEIRHEIGRLTEAMKSNESISKQSRDVLETNLRHLSEELREKLQKSKGLVASLQSPVESLPKKSKLTDKNLPSLNEDEEHILVYISDYAPFQRDWMIDNVEDYHKVKVDAVIDSLAEKGYLNVAVNGIALSPKGKKYLLDNDLV